MVPDIYYPSKKSDDFCEDVCGEVPFFPFNCHSPFYVLNSLEFLVNIGFLLLGFWGIMKYVVVFFHSGIAYKP